MKATSIIALVLSWTLASCQSSVGLDDTATGASIDLSSLTPAVPDPGVKDFEQSINYMLRVTNMDRVPKRDNIYTFLNSFSTPASLNQKQNISEITSSHYSTLTRTAAAVCYSFWPDEAVSNPTGNFPFYVPILLEGSGLEGIFTNQATPAQALTAAYQEQLIRFFERKFWGEELSPTETRTQDLAEVRQLITDILQSASMTNRSVTRSVLLSVCTSMLASGAAIMM